MRAIRRAAAVWAVIAAVGACSSEQGASVGVLRSEALPPPGPASTYALDDALAGRRSVRAWSPEPVSLERIGKLLWAAQGETDWAGHRTAPSAGALYPLELYVASAQGVAHYVPSGHAVEWLDMPDARPALARASFNEQVVRHAPLIVVFAGVVARTRSKYGDRAERYVALEAGHAAQNLVLEATAMGMGGVTIGAFEDEAVRTALKLPSGHFPYYLIALGDKPQG